MFDSGWLLPNGEWHTCAPCAHDEYLYITFNMDTATAERLGYARVYDKHTIRHRGFKLTPEQRNWLLFEGYEINEWD
jgi:hypothetical protein